MITLKKTVAGFFLGVLCAASVFSVYYCVTAGIADATTLELRQTLLQVRAEGKVPGPVQWRELVQGLDHASQLVPDAPQYHEDTAFLYAVRGVAALKFPAIAKHNLEQALINYQQALSTRPMSPASWANMALAAHYLGKSDEEVGSLFDTAMHLGRNDPGTQIPLFFLGMQRWGSLSENRKRQLIVTLKQAKQPLKQELKAILIQFHIGEL